MGVAGKDSVVTSENSLESFATFVKKKLCKKLLISVQPDSFKPCSVRSLIKNEAISACNADVLSSRHLLVAFDDVCNAFSHAWNIYQNLNM